MMSAVLSSLRLSRALPLLGTLALAGCEMNRTVTVDRDKELTGDATQAIVTLPSGATLDVDPYRSLLVVDQEVRDAFSFEEVMNLLVQRTGLGNLTPQSLYQQWWDTNNDQAHSWTTGPHCTPPAEPYNMFCPRQEGVLANPVNFPFGANAAGRHGFHALAFVNRFDLAPANGQHCGEYRMVFAKNSGTTKNNDRLIISFEGRLPNPNPSAGLAACRPVAQFWADLSSMEDVNDRAQALRTFFIDGLPGFAPIVHPNSFGLIGGQIRTNQFMFQFMAQLWQLREYKFIKQCPGGNCKVEIWNMGAKSNPEPELFSPEGTSPLGPQARADFLTQMPTLLAGNLQDIKLNLSTAYNTTHSDSFNNMNEYGAQIGTFPAFQDAITARLTQLGQTDITWRQLADRATTQSCAGCHMPKTTRNLGAGLIWPPSNGFTHIDEQRTETIVDDLGMVIGTRPLISPALKTTWLPLRKQNLESFLAAP
jgi:hypothetical protein